MDVERKIIYSPEAPSSPLYSQGVKAGNFLFLSGFVGMDPRTRQLAGDTIEEQTQQAIRNCESVLRSAGSELVDVVQVIVLLSDPADFDGMNREYARSFPDGPPARMVAKLGVSLPKVKVSLAMTAVLKGPEA
jgi:2-iminobutanoate/2-iminopropanoate deaminase